MASELARQILDAGFPAAKPVRDHDLFGIPTLEERWNNFALNFAFPSGASIPTNGKRTADLLQSMVKSLIDAVDGSSTGTSVPWMWALLRLPRFRGASHADDNDNRFRHRQVSFPGSRRRRW